MPTLKITKSQIDKLGVEHAGKLYWDADLRGFGVKVLSDGSKTYVAQYRTIRGRSGVTKRFTIGRHGSWTADLAREEARRIFLSVAMGNDPAALEQAVRKASTVSELCELYVREGMGTKKASTASTDISRIKSHILPLLGNRRLTDITSLDVRKFMVDVAAGRTKADFRTDKPGGRAIVRGGRGAASRTVGLLGGIFSFAVEAKLMASNPVRGVERFADKKNVRYLTGEQIVALGVALDRAELEGANPMAIAIIKLLLLTGARKGEIESVRLREIDQPSRALRLPDSKTGQKVILLGAAALEIIDFEMTRAPQSRTFLFEGENGKPYSGVPKVWAKVKKIAGFTDLRLHDLRHSFASLAVLKGTPIAIVGSLLGHSDSATTQRYAHLADDPIRHALEQVGSDIASALRLRPR